MAELLRHGFSQLGNWLEELPTSKTWKDNIFVILSALYAVIAAAAFIQLIRIQRRVPEYGWTTQKVFHLLNFLVSGVRAGVFLFYEDVNQLQPRIFELVLLDLPGLLFFTTYSLLVLFWAEIYYQACSLPTDGLRPLFLILNAVLYVVQICLWIFFWRSPHAVIMVFSNIFIAAWSLCAASGFLIYGGRLSIMLRRFPAESRGRQKKLQEIGLVTTICFSCFLIRCLMILSSAFLKSAEINPLKHPLLTSVYYMLVEIVPAALVLFILRKLPRSTVHVDKPGSSGERDDDSSFMASA